MLLYALRSKGHYPLSLGADVARFCLLWVTALSQCVFDCRKWVQAFEKRMFIANQKSPRRTLRVRCPFPT